MIESQTHTVNKKYCKERWKKAEAKQQQKYTLLFSRALVMTGCARKSNRPKQKKRSSSSDVYGTKHLFLFLVRCFYYSDESLWWRHAVRASLSGFILIIVYAKGNQFIIIWKPNKNVHVAIYTLFSIRWRFVSHKNANENLQL